MTTILSCPSCGTPLKIPAASVAVALQCPACKGRIVSDAAPAPETRANAGGTPATLLKGNPAPRFPGYELLGLLGKGGMGEVYKARHLRLDRVVALKVIRDGLLNEPDLVRRFRQEARAAARLAHPNIVAIYDFVEEAGGHFLALEFVEGADLATLVARRGPLPAAQACEAIRQAALGLQHAHERGLVHRDIKPHNLLAAADGGAVKVADLGLALLQPATAAGKADATLTRPGMAMGTPAYLAPEQAIDAHNVDARADIYGLGCTFYHLLVGRPPFPGRTPHELAARHRWAEAEPLEQLRPDLPSGLAAVVRRMTAKPPEDRFPTAAEVAAVLRPYCLSGANATTAGEAGKSTADAAAIPTVRFTARRGRAWMIAAGVGGLAMVVLAATIIGAFRPGADLKNSPTDAGADSPSRVPPHEASSSTGTLGAPPAPARETIRDASALLADLKSGNAARAMAATIVLQTKDPAAPDRPVAQALEDLLANDELLHIGASRALIHWATAESAPALIAALGDEDANVRSNAMEALGALKAKSAFRPIAQKLDTRDRLKAAEVLCAIGPEAESAVLEHAHAEDVFTRNEVCKVLNRIGTNRSELTLKNLSAEDSQLIIRVAASEALKAIGNRK